MALKYTSGSGPMIESSGISGSPINSTASSKCLGVGRSTCKRPDKAETGHDFCMVRLASSSEFAQQTLICPKQGFPEPPLSLKVFTISSPGVVLINPSESWPARVAVSEPEAARYIGGRLSGRV